MPSYSASASSRRTSTAACYRFEPVDDKPLRYGLGAIKGTGQGAIEAIVAARDGTGEREGEGGGPFRSLFDFARASTASASTSARSRR